MEMQGQNCYRRGMQIYLKPLPQDFLNRVRERGLDDQLQPVRRYVSTEGGEPCRDVMRFARPGEEVILASFCPYTQAGPYKEFGPVYVLASPSEEEVQRNRLPLPAGQVETFLGERFALRAYDHSESIIDGELANAADAEAIVARFLKRPEVAFVQARFPTHGCFACRIERAND